MKIGIIGGSGLDNPEMLQDYEEVEVETPYGKPSSKITCGKISGVDVCILARHGRNHELSPSNINYRANIFALKQKGCDYILASSAIGSLKEEIRPGDIIIPNQIIDFTKTRKSTFFDKVGKVEHIGMADPFSEELRNKLIESAIELQLAFHNTGTVITIEGPRFSTRAESFMFRNLGADLVGMTTATEAFLAKEAGIKYAVVAMSTDYDCWKQNEESVSWEMIKKRMEENSEKVKRLIIKTIEKFSEQKILNEEIKMIKENIRTIPDFPKPGIQFRDITTLMKNPEAMKKTIDLLVQRYQNKDINSIAGIESRGFIFGSILAEKLGKVFVPVRKPGKLPAETEKQEYELEYGKDAVEIHKDAVNSGDKILVIDDLLATGGTAEATCMLIEKLGGKIIECGFVIELPVLNGREKLKNWDVFSVVEFLGK